MLGDNVSVDNVFWGQHIGGTMNWGTTSLGDSPSGDNPLGDNVSGDSVSKDNASGDNPFGDNALGDNISVKNLSVTTLSVNHWSPVKKSSDWKCPFLSWGGHHELKWCRCRCNALVTNDGSGLIFCQRARFIFTRKVTKVNQLRPIGSVVIIISRHLAFFSFTFFLNKR